MSAVVIDLGPLKKFKRQIEADLRFNAKGPIRRALHQWGERFRGFVQRRFHKLSKGGGSWVPLKRSTIMRRRAGKRGPRTKGGRIGAAGVAGARVSILRDTNTLFTALDPIFAKKPGQIQDDIPFGVRVGFGGSEKHPKAKLTVFRLAQIHHEGLGNVPARPLIVEPDNATQNGMRKDMERGLQRLLDESGSV